MSICRSEMVNTDMIARSAFSTSVTCGKSSNMAIDTSISHG